MKNEPVQAVYIADFETVNDPEDCRVWAACAVELSTNNVAYIGNDLDGFMEFLSERNSIVYFHNLAFDGQFIISWLLRNGYTYAETKEDKKKEKTFDCTISDAGQFYYMNIRFKRNWKEYYRTQIRDSLKKINAKVERIAEAYKLPFHKLTIDYNEKREKGHILTDAEREYVVADCKIVAAALLQHIEKGMDRITASSDAFTIFKRDYLGENLFDYYFPCLPLELDKEIRKAYRGGFTYLNPKFANVRDLPGIVLDVNSEYPYILHDKPLPVGYPVFFKGNPEPDDRFPLYICRCQFAFRIKPDRIPCIQIKNTFMFKQNEYLTDSKGEIIELFLTNLDLELIKDQYDLFDFKILSGWRFQAKTGLFTKYIDNFYEIKRNSKGALREIAKLMLNSVYGKTGTNPERYTKIPFLDIAGVVHYRISDPEYVKPIYTALAAFVTAYGRDLIIRAAQANYPRFIYSDTDSIHLIGNDLPDGLKIDPSELGAFKIEEEFTDSLYLRQKTYMHTVNDKITVKCAGMPDVCKKQVTYDNFKIGNRFYGKLMHKIVKGGVVLYESYFTIN